MADAESTKSGMELTLASDGAYELVSDRFLFVGRRSIEDSLGTRFNDIFDCSEKETGRTGGTRTRSDDRSTGGTEQLVILPCADELLGNDGRLCESLYVT